MNPFQRNIHYQKIVNTNKYKQCVQKSPNSQFSNSNKNIKSPNFNNYKNKVIYTSNILRSGDKRNDITYSTTNLKNSKLIQKNSPNNTKVNLSNYAFHESKCFSHRRNKDNIKTINKISNKKNIEKKDENNAVFFSIYKNHNFPKSNQNNMYNSVIINHFQESGNYFINNQNNFSEKKKSHYFSRFHNNFHNNNDLYKIRNKTPNKNKLNVVKLDPRINKYLKQDYNKKSAKSHNNLLEKTDNHLFKNIYFSGRNSYSNENRTPDFFSNSMNNISIKDSISENISINKISSKKRHTFSPQNACSLLIENKEPKSKTNKKNKKFLENNKKNENTENLIKETIPKKKKANNIKKISVINNFNDTNDNKFPNYNEESYESGTANASLQIIQPNETSQNNISNNSNNKNENTSKNEKNDNNLLEKINIESISETKKNNLNENNTSNETSHKENNNSFIKRCEAISVAGIDICGTKINQDTYLIEKNINGFENFNMFGVLDGHGKDSHLVSQFIKDFIIFRIKNHPLLKYLKNLKDIYNKLIESKYKIIADTYKDADNELQKVGIDVINSGTTCVIVIQIEEHLICANVGDSRAILIYDEDFNDKNLNKSIICPLSYDCKPDLPNEKQRIEKFGGIVMQSKDPFGNGIGPYRVWNDTMTMPGIAMSRSIGDIFSKTLGVIPDPQIVEYTLSEKSKYMIICSDGVWEFISNEDAMKIGNKYYLRNDPVSFCLEIVNQSFNLWKENDTHVDDITSVVVFF